MLKVKEEKSKKTDRIQVWIDPKRKDELIEIASQQGMNLSEYILKCVTNQPAIPTITYQTDDLNEIIDILCDVKRSLEGLTDGLVLTGSVTERDIQRLMEMNQQMNEQYLNVVQKYDTQRNQVTKTARRLVREWKQSEQKAKKEAP